MGSIFMIKRKVSPEEKIAAVESYLNGDRQLHTILEQYGIAKEAFRIRVVRRKEPGTLWSKRRRAGVWRQSAGLTGCTYGTGSSFTPLQGAPELPGTLPRACSIEAIPHPGSTPEGTRDIMEQTPSCRRLATVRRTVALNRSSPFGVNKIQDLP